MKTNFFSACCFAEVAFSGKVIEVKCSPQLKREIKAEFYEVLPEEWGVCEKCRKLTKPFL